MEGVGRVTTVVRRVGQGAEHLPELRHRARPAVGQQQWPGRRFGRTRMDEMDALPVDPGGELGKGVGPGLEARPVVVVLPVPAQLDQEIAFGAVLPPGAGYLVGPPGPGQPVTEIVDLGGGDAHIKGLDGRWGHGLVHSRVTSVGGRWAHCGPFSCGSFTGPADGSSTTTSQNERNYMTNLERQDELAPP